jgi:hypothetical protein
MLMDLMEIVFDLDKIMIGLEIMTNLYLNSDIMDFHEV